MRSSVLQSHFCGQQRGEALQSIFSGKKGGISGEVRIDSWERVIGNWREITKKRTK